MCARESIKITFQLFPNPRRDGDPGEGVDTTPLESFGTGITLEISRKLGNCTILLYVATGGDANRYFGQTAPAKLLEWCTPTII